MDSHVTGTGTWMLDGLLHFMTAMRVPHNLNNYQTYVPPTLLSYRTTEYQTFPASTPHDANAGTYHY